MNLRSNPFLVIVVNSNFYSSSLCEVLFEQMIACKFDTLSIKVCDFFKVPNEGSPIYISGSFHMKLLCPWRKEKYQQIGTQKEM